MTPENDYTGNSAYTKMQELHAQVIDRARGGQ